MKIVWFVSSLEQKGGGERFALEGLAALKAKGEDAMIVCDRLGAAASFDGLYDLSEVVCTGKAHDGSAGYLSQVIDKAKGTIALHGLLKRIKPDLVICQSEYDAIKMFLLSKLLGFRYRVFVFGQMFQFRTDISRYSTTFRRHLETIVASRPGYRSTVTMPPPRLSVAVSVINEVVSRLKYWAHRGADRVFTLSDQVSWEVSLLYGRQAVTAPAAFSSAFIDLQALAAPRPVSRPVRFLSVCRLAEKKRIELTIEGFSRAQVPGQLILIGTGPEEARLRGLAEASPRRDDITLLGSVDDDRVHDELQRADCFVSMDIGDYDISVVEAMARGLRVIIPLDFDMGYFGPGFTGVRHIEPTAAAVSDAMDEVGSMSAPSLGNVPVLQQQTWEHLAETVSAS